MKLSHVLMRSAKQPPPDFLEFVGSATGGSYNNSTSYTAPLPTHIAGDLLVVFLQFAANEPSVTVNSGWTIRAYQTHPTGGNVCRVYTKVAGNSSEVFTATLNAGLRTRTSVALAFRSQTGRVPQFALLHSAYGENSFPEVTPSAGLQKYTWVPCFAAKRKTSGVSPLTMPSGYSTIQGPSVSGTNGYARLAVGRKSTHATSETPGAMAAIGNSSYPITIVAAVWEE